MSPDGALIASWQHLNPNNTKSVAIIPFEGGNPIKMLEIPSGSSTGVIRWTPDGQAIAYIDTRDAVSNIWSQPLDGRPARPLTEFKSDQIFRFEWSKDGKWLAIARGTVSEDVVLMHAYK